jgi:hypothetical protein
MSQEIEREVDGEAAADPSYAYKPSLIGSGCQFTLRPDAMEWQIGRRSGRVHYSRVGAVRLSYRPVTMQSHRFIAEIWSQGNPKIQIASVSWRSLVEQERFDRPYSAFIAELHRRIAAAGAPAEFTTGLPAITYWAGVAVFAGVMVAMGVIIVRALRLSQWSASAIIGVFFAVFAYQLGNFFRRNRPSRYRPDAIPSEVLPQS